MKTFFLLLLLLFPMWVNADTHVPKDRSQSLAQYELLLDLKEAQQISEAVFRQRTAVLQEAGLDLDEGSLMLQRGSYISSALYVVSAVLMLFLLKPLGGKLSRSLLRALNVLLHLFKRKKWLVDLCHRLWFFLKKTWEVPAYASLASILGWWAHDYLVILVALLLGALLNFSFLSRLPIVNKVYLYQKIASWSLACLWAVLAYTYDNHFIGFMAVAAWMSALGFVLLMFPGMVMMGYQQSNTRFVLRLMCISLGLSLFSWLVFYTSFFPILQPLKGLLSVFEEGMTSLIPLVYFCGLGYITFSLCKDNLVKRLFYEFVAFFSGLCVLVIALLYGISSMFWIALFFMIWSSMDTYYMLVYRKIDVIWSAFILAIVLAVLGHVIQDNLASLTGFMAFLFV